MSELALQRIAENKAKHARGEDARVLDLGNCGLTQRIGAREFGEVKSKVMAAVKKML